MSSPQLDLVHKAIRSGILGHIQWKDSAERLMRADPQMKGFTPTGVRAMLRQFVLEGNTLDARLETRQEFLEERPDDPYWYRALIPVPGMPRGLFLELILVDNDADEPWIEIVSVYRQQS